MSNFTVAVNDLLDRMKEETGTTRQQFAARIAMPLSTFSSYTKGTRPDRKALELICSNLPERDAEVLVIAHLKDETPLDWYDRLAVSTTREGTSRVNFSKYGDMPPVFIRQLEAMAIEARSNKQMIDLVNDLAGLLHLDIEEGVEWGPKDFAVQRVPTGIVLSGSPGGSTSKPKSKKAPSKKRGG